MNKRDQTSFRRKRSLFRYEKISIKDREGMKWYNSNFAHQKINCAQTVSDVARFSIWFLASKEECTRKAVIWKLPQISRIARKSLLCNVSMNTCLDDRASRVGSVISVGTLPLRRTTQWCITLQKTQRKHQRVRKCPLKYLNPPLRRVREDTFIEHRNSKAIRLPASR